MRFKVPACANDPFFNQTVQQLSNKVGLTDKFTDIYHKPDRQLTGNGQTGPQKQVCLRTQTRTYAHIVAI